MGELEGAANGHGMRIVGMSVALDDESEPARALYDHLGVSPRARPVRGERQPRGRRGPIAVGSVMTYLVKDLAS